MNGLIAMVLGVLAGAAATAFIAEQTLGSEVTAVGARLGLPASSGGASKILGLLDAVDPGASTNLKTAAVTTVVGGAAVAVVAYAVASSLLGR